MTDKSDAGSSGWKRYWPDSLVLLFGIGALGAIPGILLAALASWLRRWPSIRTVALWLLIPCLGVTWMVVQAQRGQHLHDVAEAHVEQSAAPEPSGIVDPFKPSNMFDMFDHPMSDAECTAFRAHFADRPVDVWLGTPCDPNPTTRNRLLPDGAVRSADCPILKARGWKAEAFSACAPEQATPPPPATNTRQRYLQEVAGAANQCIKSGGNTMACYIEASPQRCKSAAVQFIGNPEAGRRPWAMCVVSCADATLVGRTIGDCRK